MKPPAFQFYADDFLAGTVDMSDVEVGLYIKLLCVQWSRGGLPNDDQELLRFSKGGSTTIPSIVKAKFKVCPAEGTLKNDRLEAERQKQAVWRQKSSEGGRKSAEMRKGGSRVVEPPHQPNGNTPSPSPSPIKHERESGGGFVERPDWKEVFAYSDRIGLAEWKARDWFDEMEGCGWLDFNHRPVAKWQPILNRVKTKWEADGRPSQPPSNPQSPKPNGQRPLSVMDLKTIIAAKEESAQQLKNKHYSDGPLGGTWDDDEARQQFKAFRSEVKSLKERLAKSA